ncbi:hypothetical protein GLOTRDRAFT_121513 [Gloeophyllum trabeum ATCC 11539]|uniref:TEA domain-containing protein n=1 Tax=Gloeophyllum trabeum (strain ATCC 11539 / FP-39264 / Madison 617) TaxID=670483 RepID=S7Q5L8_GLOTA|nr:uncharacterized protein GLOTRDRAFT_121513 [Gloeophyllum trabeum ATCC 11539]EPQ55351.1 hypothetical protein GLOTRDRAFT_121513 [Gloeophyllum trabeum ATCC 11539]
MAFQPSPDHARLSPATVVDVDVDVEPDSQELAQSALHAIVNGRKSWKTIRGKSEAVWPPYLEGLQKYRQTEGLRVSALGGGRFPMRNRFISEHIKKTTGKHRTPKQVGSRLQQLRDTRGGKQVLKLLSDRNPPGSSSSLHSSPSSIESDGKGYTPGPSDRSFETTIVNIPILRPHTSGYSTPTNISTSSAHSSPSTPDTLRSPVSPVSPSSPGPSGIRTPSPGHLLNHLSVGPARPIRQIDNTLTFVSHWPLPGPGVAADTPYCYLSEFVVSGPQGEVHREYTNLQLVEKLPPSGDGTMEAKERYLYRTMLVPLFWERLCQSSDPTQYTIKQEIVKTKRDRSSAGSSASTPDLRLLSRSPSIEPTVSTDASEKIAVLSMRYQFVYHSSADVGIGAGIWPTNISSRLAVPRDERRPSTASSASSYISDEVDPNFAFSFGMDVDPASGSDQLHYDPSAIDEMLSSHTDLMLSQENNILLPPLMLDAKPEMPTNWSAPVTPVDATFSNAANMVFTPNPVAMNAFSGPGVPGYQQFGGEWEGPGGGYPYRFAEAQIQMQLSVQEDLDLKTGRGIPPIDFAFMDEGLKILSPPRSAQVNYPSPHDLEGILGTRL